MNIREAIPATLPNESGEFVSHLLPVTIKGGGHRLLPENHTISSRIRLIMADNRIPSLAARRLNLILSCERTRTVKTTFGLIIFLPPRIRKYTFLLAKSRFILSAGKMLLR